MPAFYGRIKIKEMFAAVIRLKRKRESLIFGQNSGACEEADG